MNKLLLVSLSFLLIGCTNRPIRTTLGYGAKEFASDSILVKEGKKKIAEILGISWNFRPNSSLDVDYLQDGDIIKVKIFNLFNHPFIQAVEAASAQDAICVLSNQLSIPYFGVIHTENKTLHQLKEDMTALIRKEFPQATVIIDWKDRLEYRVNCQGVINTSFAITTKNFRLSDFLKSLNFPKEVSFFNSSIKRNGKIMAVDFEKLIIDGDESQDVVINKDDLIYLADSKMAKAIVLGEVKREGVIPLEMGLTPLKEVIAKAGGITLNADRTFIQVVRGSMNHPKVYTLNYQQILKAPNDAFLLMQGDIVYVASTPIAEFNRLLNQLLPAITTYEFFHKGIQGVIIP
jgi:protein involved in polysaccharide export with SLBB domain